MSDEKKNDAPAPALDERAIARKYGLRELITPDSEQVKTAVAFLTASLANGRAGIVPKPTMLVLLEFLQATVNRQHITKGPRMSQDEFDALQTPYYVAARTVSKIQRARFGESEKSRLYQSTHLSLHQFIELLRNLLDPSCFWLRAKALPEDVRDAMDGLRQFLVLYPEQRRKGRAT